MRLEKRTENRADIGQKAWDSLPVALIPVAAAGPLQMLWNVGEYFVAILVAL